MHTTTPFNKDTTDVDYLANRRVAARLGWFVHALVYLAVIGGLTVFALWQERHPPLGAAFGWGLGLTVHGLRVFFIGAGTRLRARLVDAERQRLISARRS